MKKALSAISLILLFSFVTKAVNAPQPKLADSITLTQQEAIELYNRMAGISQVFKTMNTVPTPAQANYYADSLLAPAEALLLKKLNDTSKVKK